MPREWTFVRGGRATIDEPLYRCPTIAYAAQVLAVVGAGVARAALRSARAWFYDLSHEVWETVVAGDEATDQQNAHLRRSCCWVTRSFPGSTRSWRPRCTTRPVPC
ncbi:hypothetical protein [Lentzea sp. NPDC051838]|uniref:hypothetical protein n=1 Tax=Lentzea sp. NPDC051838 TaxID=3154849 RepID=UPI003441AC71